MTWERFLIPGPLHDGVIKWKHFRVTGHLCGEFTGDQWIPRTKASEAELWCFLWSAPESSRWWFETPSRLLWRHCNGERNPPITGGLSYTLAIIREPIERGDIPYVIFLPLVACLPYVKQLNAKFLRIFVWPLMYAIVCQPSGCWLGSISFHYSDVIVSVFSLTIMREFTGERWIFRRKGQSGGKFVHLMTSSCAFLVWLLVYWSSHVAQAQSLQIMLTLFPMHSYLFNLFSLYKERTIKS